jgi:hypothetical protein
MFNTKTSVCIGMKMSLLYIKRLKYLHLLNNYCSIVLNSSVRWYTVSCRPRNDIEDGGFGQATS